MKKQNLLIGLLLVLAVHAHADTQITPQYLDINILRGTEAIHQFNLTNTGNTTQNLLLNNIYGDESKNWIQIIPPQITLQPAETQTIIANIAAPAAINIGTYKSYLYLPSGPIPITINIQTEYNPYFTVSPTQKKIKVGEQVCWDIYCLLLEDATDTEADFTVYEDGDELNTYTCQENHQCNLEDEFGVYLHKTRDSDYVKVTVLSDEEGLQLTEGTPYQYTLISNEELNTGETICIDDVTQWIRFDRVSYQTADFIYRERLTENRERCITSRECPVSGDYNLLFTVLGYDYTTQEGKISLTLQSKDLHYAFKCEPNKPLEPEPTQPGTSGDLIIEQVAGTIKPGATTWFMIMTKNYDLVTSGTVTVDTNTDPPLPPKNIASDGQVKVSFPIDMMCPVKLTARVSGYKPTSIFPEECSEEGRQNKTWIDTSTTGNKDRLEIIHTGTTLRLGDDTIITVLSKGQPIQGVQVTVKHPDNRIDHLTTDQRGEVQYLLTKTGEYTVTATHPGYLDPSQPHKIRVNPKELLLELSNTNPAIDEEITIKVMSTGSPITDATIRIRKPDGQTTTIYSSSIGETFTPDKPGKYVVEASKQDYETRTREFTVPPRKMSITTNPASLECGQTIYPIAKDTETGETLNPLFYLNGEAVNTPVTLPLTAGTIQLSAKLLDYEDALMEYDVPCVARLISTPRKEYNEGEPIILRFTKNTDINLLKNNVNYPVPGNRNYYNLTLKAGNYTLKSWTNMPENTPQINFTVRKGFGLTENWKYLAVLAIISYFAYQNRNKIFSTGIVGERQYGGSLSEPEQWESTK